MDATKIHTTEKIAKILDLPDWRVVRFAQVKKFGITPSLAEAQGSGSRRIYDLENVYEIALASWLVEAGLRIEVIGRVIKQMRRKGGLRHLKTKRYLGVLRSPRGKIIGQETEVIEDWDHLEDIFRQNPEASLVMIPTARFQWLAEKLEKQAQQGD
jgi:DNA-binding transcriptional MerR regulator